MRRWISKKSVSSPFCMQKAYRQRSHGCLSVIKVISEVLVFSRTIHGPPSNQTDYPGYSATALIDARSIRCSVNSRGGLDSSTLRSDSAYDIRVL